ncbi:MAG TPA: VOC family protein [Oculatellaceae cyanobacterium]
MPVKSNVKLDTLAYVILYVKDTAKAVTFYQDVLGAKVKFNEDGWVELETGAVTLALHKEGEKSGTAGSSSTVVFAVKDVKQTYQDLKSVGVKFSGEPHQVCETPDSIGISADFKDPDGNSLSIFGMEKK